MKLLIISLAVIVTISEQAFAERSWDQVCGFSDDVYDYIRATAGEAKKGMVHAKPRQGESNRHIIFYENGDWVVIYEFYSLAAVENDVTCIVASGHYGDPAAVEWTDKKIQALPAVFYKNFGQNPDDLIPMKSFRRPGSIVPSQAPPPPSVEA